MRTEKKVASFPYILILTAAVALSFLLSRNDATGKVSEIPAFPAPVAGIALLSVFALLAAVKLEERIRKDQ